MAMSRTGRPVPVTILILAAIVGIVEMEGTFHDTILPLGNAHRLDTRHSGVDDWITEEWRKGAPMTTKATPRPWRYSQAEEPYHAGNDELVCPIVVEAGPFEFKCEPFAASFSEAKANAALIVRAVNSYDAMVQALKDIERTLCVNGTITTYKDDVSYALDLTRAALALAEGD